MADPAWVTNARTRWDQIWSELAALDETSPTGAMDKPETSGGDFGVKGQDQKTRLYSELESIEKRLAAAGFDVETTGGDAGVYESEEFS